MIDNDNRHLDGLTDKHCEALRLYVASAFDETEAARMAGISARTMRRIRTSPPGKRFLKRMHALLDMRAVDITVLCLVNYWRNMAGKCNKS